MVSFVDAVNLGTTYAFSLRLGALSTRCFTLCISIFGFYLMQRFVVINTSIDYNDDNDFCR
ncbi:hypothetical protein CO180_01420 [candidate division WWE3 bacterium CG_4_9_14_3_um_filter_41_6]|uniref:Uncharacterized protein n=1 Tax=candidate division WWE3 bacterium CG_4_10_14_0_2_um_filter_41_14 TaxID=1975072 RepID=A0A2M7TJQ2_UNCKA|nr:MAG: hypothetical protein COY32_02705 [candidate division WWE3 bacterium CG_4_10_14_0_2_um_filter_41_14]PJA39172.1 MAG: hypothetical protein CO180_01420 [candidate division WWE3 bacterium CG_4_9_14_3_um_filter_41_6]